MTLHSVLSAVVSHHTREHRGTGEPRTADVGPLTSYTASPLTELTSQPHENKTPKRSGLPSCHSSLWCLTVLIPTPDHPRTVNIDLLPRDLSEPSNVHQSSQHSQLQSHLPTVMACTAPGMAEERPSYSTKQIEENTFWTTYVAIAPSSHQVLFYFCCIPPPPPPPPLPIPSSYSKERFMLASPN